MARSLSTLAPLAALALLLSACGPSSTTTPQNDAGGADRLAQHDAQLDGPLQSDGPLQNDAPVQNDGGVQHDANVDATPAMTVTDIRALQHDPSFTGTTVPVNTRVQVQGAVVTASKPTASVFFIQNPTGPKEYSGILVKKGGLTTMPAVGDVITSLDATLLEESRSCSADGGLCPTRHSLGSPANLVLNAGAGTVPAPLGVTSATILADTGKYDGVLLQLTDSPLTVQSASAAGSSVTIEVATGLAIYSNYYAPPGLPPTGTVITTAIGPLDIYNRTWEMYPRTAADLVFQDWPPDGGVQSDGGAQQDASTPDDGPFSGDAAPCGSDNVVISQVYGGGGSSGATYKNDFIELFNRGAAPANVGSWSVQYGAYAGDTWTKISLAGKTIPAGGYLLVGLGTNGGAGSDLPTADVTYGSLNISAYRGKVALVKNNTELTGACPTFDASMADFVGYNSAVNCSDGAPAEGGSSTDYAHAIIRKNAGCQDYNNNAYDFTLGTPAPRNSSTAVNACGC